MRNLLPVPTKYLALLRVENCAKAWTVAAVLALLSSINVGVGGAATVETPAMDSGFEQTSTNVSIDGSEVVDLSDGDTMLIIEDVPLGTHLEVRSKNAGSWGETIDLDSHGDEGPDATAGEGSNSSKFTANIGPIWLGEGAEAVEVTSLRPIDVTVTSLRPSNDGADQEETRVNGTRLMADQPGIRARSAWAESGWSYETDGCEDGPELAPSVKAIVVHHSATSNNYTQADVDDILRGIYHVHVNINGWCDIGYNFVVDKFGTLWEARTGGTDNAVIGGHARGFNTDTSGIALLGQHHTEAQPAHAAPTAASKDTLAKFAAWKLSLAGVSPTQKVELLNRVSDTTHNLPAIVGHGDVGQTSCPGNLTIPFVQDELPGLAAEHVGSNTYVGALSQTFDGRALRDEEITFWERQVEQLGQESVANRFARSEYNVGRVVDRLYQTALGRPADAQGRADWISRIQGGYTYQQVALHFYGSDEISRRHADDSRYVTQLYRSVLGREPDARGRADWTLVLQTNQRSRRQVAAHFIQSNEGREQRVAAMYLDVLGRPADSAGLTSWAGYLATRDDFSLAARFAVSNEYQSKV